MTQHTYIGLHITQSHTLTHTHTRSQVIGIISATGGVSSMLLLPCLFALTLLRLPVYEKVVCVVLCVASVGLSGLGLYASLAQLLERSV